MRRWSQVVASSALALLMLGAAAAPGSAAEAAAPHPDQWWFVTWGVEDQLWPRSKGQGVTVAVLDTGVEAGIPDLAGAVLPGTDFEGGGGDGRIDSDDAEVAGHGTGMASLIAANGDGTGFLGVAPQAKILPIITQSTTAYVEGIRYATDHGASVISLSQAVAGTCPPDLQESVNYALAHDAVVLAGAGNDGGASNLSMHPANCTGVLAVGAVDADFRPWSRSQQQPYVTIAAPGVAVSSVLKDGEVHTSPGGTSGATALAAGATALVRSRFPEMNNREVVRQLIGSTLDVAPEGRDDRAGFGLIRPAAIFNGNVPSSAPNPVFDDYDRLLQQQNARPSVEPQVKTDFDAVISVAVWGAIGVIALAVVAFIRIRKRRMPVPAGHAQGMPPTLGAPHPPQRQHPGGAPTQYPRQQLGPIQRPPDPPRQWPRP